ncbi:hypothetical protein ACH5RR_008820 [Cinchona calisaya]|uniref:Uncharacterized protein n=1 Tax=Cinchona calisaya TaxID=153742 RepID=A0ABD3AD68_9GENT
MGKEKLDSTKEKDIIDVPPAEGKESKNLLEKLNLADVSILISSKMMIMFDERIPPTVQELKDFSKAMGTRLGQPASIEDSDESP